MHAPEQQLRLHRLLVENSLGLMCIHDLDGVLLTVNPAAASSLGYPPDESRGRNIRDFLVPSVRHLFEEYLQRIRRNAVDNGMMRLLAKDGTERIWLYRNIRYEEPGSPVLVLGHALDITERMITERALKQSQADLVRARDELERRVAERTSELRVANEKLLNEIEQRKQIQEELLRARNLETIARLAGGIAHEFNTLMTIIVGRCESMKSELEGKPPLQHQINEIYKAAEQANSLTRELLTFSRHGSRHIELLNLNDVLISMSNTLRGMLGEKIELTTLTGSSLGLIRADRGQIEQVIANLVTNASQAMPSGGKLVLSTVSIEIEESDWSQGRGGSPKSFVRLTVSDTGTGMDAEVKARIFDPFFTTREWGQAAGLGLTTVYGIVNSMGGKVEVESEPGKGTTLRLFFPQDARPHKPEVERACEQPVSGTETLLVVDDQEGLRTLLCETLRSKGYTVLSAPNGLHALRIVHEFPGRIDLVITDMVMPQMGGRELVYALQELPSQPRILCMSGYTDMPEAVHDLLLRGAAFLEKPFTPKVLLDKIREVLGSPRIRSKSA